MITPIFPRINLRQCGLPVATTFFLSPGVATVCSAGTIQLTAKTNDGTADTTVSDGIVWNSSNTGIATVNGSGLVTRVADGQVVISATRNGVVAFSKLSLFTSGTCCNDVHVGTVLMIDRSPSMSAAFGPDFPSCFYVAKVVALAVAGSLAEDKDTLAVEEFDGAGEIIASLMNDKTDLEAKISSVYTSTLAQDTTDILNAFARAVLTAQGCVDCGQQVIILISDGVIEPVPGSQDMDDLATFAQIFEDAGGIVQCVGIKATGDGYVLLRDLATPGYFTNIPGDAGAISTALTAILALKSHYCAG